MIYNQINDIQYLPNDIWFNILKQASNGNIPFLIRIKWINRYFYSISKIKFDIRIFFIVKTSISPI